MASNLRKNNDSELEVQYYNDEEDASIPPEEVKSLTPDDELPPVPEGNVKYESHTKTIDSCNFSPAQSPLNDVVPEASRESQVDTPVSTRGHQVNQQGQDTAEPTQARGGHGALNSDSASGSVRQSEGGNNEEGLI